MSVIILLSVTTYKNTSILVLISMKIVFLGVSIIGYTSSLLESNTPVLLTRDGAGFPESFLEGLPERKL